MIKRFKFLTKICKKKELRGKKHVIPATCTSDGDFSNYYNQLLHYLLKKANLKQTDFCKT